MTTSRMLVFNRSRGVVNTTGLEPDAITCIDQTPIRSAEEAKRAFDYYSAGVLQLVFVRGGVSCRSLPFRVR